MLLFGLSCKVGLLSFHYSHPIRSRLLSSIGILIAFFSLFTKPVKSESEFSTNTIIRINCGGQAFTDSEGRFFAADRPYTGSNDWGYVGGSVGMAKSGTEVNDSANASLYLTERWGVRAYRFQVKPGLYRVTMFFNEFFFDAPLKRVFDISLNERISVPALDIVGRVGPNTALQVVRTLETTNGWIDLATHEISDRCKFSAIAIEPAIPDTTPPPTPTDLRTYPRNGVVGLDWSATESDDLKGYFVHHASSATGVFEKIRNEPIPDPFFVHAGLTNNSVGAYRVSSVDFFGNESALGDIVLGAPHSLNSLEVSFGINVGGSTVTDAQHRVFLEDRAYNPGSGVGFLRSGASLQAPNTAMEEPFRSLRQGDLMYRFDLPPDAYHVTLGFYDPFSREAKDRVFSVYLNELRVLHDFDLYEQYGRRLPAEIHRTFRVGTNGLIVAFQGLHGQPVCSFLHVEPTALDQEAPAAPEIVRVIARDEVAHIEWTASADPDLIGYQVLRAENQSFAFHCLPDGWVGVNAYTDTSVTNGGRYRYKVLARDASRNESPVSNEAEAKPRFPTDDELLDIVSRAAFEYFVRECDPKTYLTRDKSTAEAMSVAAMGFGLSALCVGAEREWMPRTEAERRAYLMLRALNNQPDNRVDGMFFHYLKGDGSRSGGGYEDVTSTIDTALLMWGAIAAGEYFGGRVRNETETMLKRCNWKSYANTGRKLVAMAYRPQHKVYDGLWDYYTDEAILVTLLGIGADQPDFRLSPEYFYTFLRDRKNYKEFKNIVCSWTGALFTYAFAHCWLDFQSLGPDHPEAIGQPAELRTDWWTNSVTACRANKAFCAYLAKRYKTFGENAWGLTASSGPEGRYIVGGAPPCGAGAEHGEGTLALYGAGMAVPFVPEDALAALKFYYTFKDADGRKRLWKDEFDGGYGLIDAFNLDKNWFSDEVHGINHGPMLLLIENYRSGLIWKTVSNSRFVRDALERIGYPAALDTTTNH